MKTPKIILPVFDSMTQCAGATGIPLPILRRAKRAGCDAFTAGSRVALGPLLHYLFGDAASHDGVCNWSDELRKWQARRQEQAWQERAHELIERSRVITFFAALATRQKDILRQRLENELPARMAGVDPGSGRVIAKRVVDEICDEMQKAVEECAKLS